MINTIKAVMTKSGVNKEDVAGIGISGQMHGLVMLDKDNNVLRKSIIWCDQRTAAEVEEMNEKLGREKLIKITANPALTGWTAAKILWVKNNEPDIYEKCRHSSAKRLLEIYPHRRICNRGFRRKRYAAS